MSGFSEVPAHLPDPDRRARKTRKRRHLDPDRPSRDWTPLVPLAPGETALTLRDEFDRVVELRSREIVHALVESAVGGNLKAIAIVLANAQAFQQETGGIKTVFEGIRLEVSPGTEINVSRVLRDAESHQVPRDVELLTQGGS